jgi:hypothetical protein
MGYEPGTGGHVLSISGSGFIIHMDDEGKETECFE